MSARTVAIFAALGLYALSIGLAYKKGADSERELSRREYTLQLERVLSENQRSIAAERRVSSEHRKRISDLEARYASADIDIGPVRLCVSAPTIVSDASASAARSDGASAGGRLPEEAQRDIGPDLIAMTKLADQQTARLLSCQQYARSVEQYAKAINAQPSQPE